MFIRNKIKFLAICLSSTALIWPCMATDHTDVKDLFNSARKFNHHFSHKHEGGDFDFNIEATSWAKLDETKDKDNDEYYVEDYYYMGIHMKFTPGKTDKINQVVKRYDIKVTPTANISCTRESCQEHQFGHHRHRTRTDAYTTEELYLLKSSPDTDSERASYTSSISWGASLSLGFFGGTPTGGLSGSWSWSSSYTVDLKDTAITNSSPNNTAGWRFDILPGSKISTNTFQPVVQALWSSPGSTRKKNRDLYEQDYMNFDITLASTAYQWDRDTVKKYKDDKYKAQKLVEEQTSLPIGHCGGNSYIYEEAKKTKSNFAVNSLYFTHYQEAKNLDLFVQLSHIPGYIYLIPEKESHGVSMKAGNISIPFWKEK